MAKEQVQRTLFSDRKIAVKGKAAPITKRKVVFKPYCQDQEFVLPKNINDFVIPGHIARLISSVIDGMNIDTIIETYKGGGTSSYDPRMLLKVWCLGFVDKTYSCRSLAKSLRENLAFIWISGNQAPDFRTLNNFRLRLKDDIKTVFKEIVQYGLELGIIEAKDVFVDHTKKAANANKHKVVWRKQVENQSKKIDAELDELFDYVDKINEEEGKTFENKDLPEQERNGFDKGKVEELVDKINKRVKGGTISREEGGKARKKVRRTGELVERKKQYKIKKETLGERNSYSKTDTDAVAMRMKDMVTTRPAYNEGVATENGFVLNYVVSDSAADNVSFIPLMEGAIDNLGTAPENANGDGAYGNEENHGFLEEKGIGNFLKYNTYHKEKGKKWRGQKLRLADFAYDNEKDEFTCKNGAKLKLVREFEKTTRTGYIQHLKEYQAEEGKCLGCPFRALCTKAEARSLHVNWNAERLKQQAKLNLDSDKGKELRKRRGNETESAFGDGKFNKGKCRYLLRGLEKVNVEAGLGYIAHDLRKIHRFMVNGKEATASLGKGTGKLVLNQFLAPNMEFHS